MSICNPFEYIFQAYIRFLLLYARGELLLIRPTCFPAAARHGEAVSPGQTSNTDPREVHGEPGGFAQAACAALKADVRALPGHAGAHRQQRRAGTHRATGGGVPQGRRRGAAAERPRATCTQDGKLGRY